MLENGKGAGGMGRPAYRKRQTDNWERGGKVGYQDRSWHADGAVAKGRNSDFITQSPVNGAASKYVDEGAGPSPSSGQSPQAAIADLEQRLAGVSQDFSGALQKISEKDIQKFDLIFAILSELQGRQAQLEETVRQLNTQYGNGQMSTSGSGSTAGTSPAAMPTSTSSSYGQMGGHGMGGHSMGGQQTMQPYPGVMGPDGSQAMYQMPQMQQVLVVQSPTGQNMQYAMPSMPSPANGMPQMQMQAMQYMPQSPNGQDMSGSYAASVPGASSENEASPVPSSDVPEPKDADR